jgi:NADH dehydrogenase
MSESSPQQLSVFLTGGSGFVGGYVSRRLLERGHRVQALVRDPDGSADLRLSGAELVRGDITDPSGLERVAEGCDVVVHLVGIIRERPPTATFESVHTRGTLAIVDAAKSAGVKKFVHMSALGAHPGGTPYQRTKFEAEEIVRRSRIPHVIFRPSIIVGVGGEFVRLLLRMLRLSPVAPIVGDGRYRLQPVAVEDVAEAFVQGAERDDLQDLCFELGGPHKLTYNRVLEILCEEFRLRRLKWHVPAGLVRPLVDLASNWRLPTPVSSDEVSMLFEESIIPGEKNVLREVFGLEPRSFRSVLQTYPRSRRRGGA